MYRDGDHAAKPFHRQTIRFHLLYYLLLISSESLIDPAHTPVKVKCINEADFIVLTQSG